MDAQDDHYLKRELYDRVSRDPAVFEFLQSGSLDGVWYWNLERPDDEWMSPRFWETLGYDPARMPHRVQAWQSLVNAEDLERAIDSLGRHCADPRHPYDEVVRYRHADGSTVWIRCRGIAIRDAGGRAVRMLGAQNDITAIKRGEEAARRDAAGLAHVNDELRQFAYAMSHDMKAPANSAAMALSILAEEQAERLDEEGREMLDIASASIGRLRALVEDVLRFTRIVGSAMPPEDFDLRAVVDEAAADLGAEIAAIGARVTVSGRCPPIRGYRWQARMLAQNLLDNALKYRRPDHPPRVRIVLRPMRRPEAPGAILTVTDDGIGIDAAYHARIFEVFERLHSVDAYPGTGLGLAICKRIARQHGGDVTVDSAPGRGATFTATLIGVPA